MSRKPGQAPPVQGDTVGVYGGLQQLNCNAYDPSYYPAGICSKNRGEFAGRVAIFSSWELITPNGERIQPQTVASPQGAACGSFDGEGSGVHCFVLANWKPGQTWFARLDSIAGAAAGWTRVRATFSSLEAHQRIAVATYDLPYAIDFSGNTVFVENFGFVSRDCLSTLQRTLLVKSVEFLTDGEWISANKGTADAYLNSCFNFTIDNTADGPLIKSGGKTKFFHYTRALVNEGAGFPGGKGFLSADQSEQPWFDVPVGNLSPGPQ